MDRHSSYKSSGHGDAERYTHEPLTDSKTQIRLLEMLPGDNEECLRFSISTHSLYDVGIKFNAITYTWGKKRKTPRILIDDKVYFVGRNCYKALESIHWPWIQGRLRGNLVWVDSVCINQDDVAEKSSQVSVMGEVYARAAEVFACVGPHADDSEFLVDMTRKFAALLEDVDLYDYPDGFHCPTEYETWALSIGFETLSRLRKACYEFGQRDYWKRVWIVQEIAKAKYLSILCGTDNLYEKTLNKLDDFLFCNLCLVPSIKAKYEKLQTYERSAMCVVFLARNTKLECGLIFMLFKQYLCCDPRDRLYGLLSLIVWPGDKDPIIPDYQISMTDLTIQTEPYVKLEYIPYMLASFKITSSDKIIKDLINQRRGGGARRDVKESIEPERPFKPLYDVYMHSWSLCSYTGVDGAEGLTAKLTIEPPKRHDMSLSHFCLHQQLIPTILRMTPGAR